MPSRIGNPQRRRKHFIQLWRERRGLSQEELAARIGERTSKGSISRIESGRSGYTQDALEAIAEALGTHPAILLSRGPQPEELGAPQDRKAPKK